MLSVHFDYEYNTCYYSVKYITRDFPRYPRVLTMMNQQSWNGLFKTGIKGENHILGSIANVKTWHDI